MPIPAYIICSESGSIDRSKQNADRVSYFDIHEVINIRRVTSHDAQGKPTDIGRPFIARIVASWIRLPDESADVIYEGQMVGRLVDPSGPRGESVIFDFGKFTLKHIAHRLLIPEMRMPSFPGPGILEIECRIRPVGEKGWPFRQTYPIVLVEDTSAEPLQEDSLPPPPVTT